MKNFFILISLCIGLSFLYSCSDDNLPDENQTEIPEEPTIPEDPGDEDDDPLNPNPQNISYDNAVTITFSSGSVSIENNQQTSEYTLVDARVAYRAQK